MFVFTFFSINKNCKNAKFAVIFSQFKKTTKENYFFVFNLTFCFVNNKVDI